MDASTLWAEKYKKTGLKKKGLRLEQTRKCASTTLFYMQKRSRGVFWCTGFEVVCAGGCCGTMKMDGVRKAVIDGPRNKSGELSGRMTPGRAKQANMALDKIQNSSGDEKKSGLKGPQVTEL